jgi:ATP:ADP antiporter, AAA family
MSERDTGRPTRDDAAGVSTHLRKIVDVRPGEVRAMVLGCAYFFFLLSSYFILRPIRDEISVASGTSRLPWLFTGTLIATLALNPLFSSLVVKFPVRTFIPYAYRFFTANLVLFYLLIRFYSTRAEVWIGPAFFIWTSVFNLFVVSVFWGFMADTFREEQGKRLFGFIGFGGTIGGVVGSAITATLAQTLGTAALLLISAALLECAVQVVRRFPVLATGAGTGAATARERPIGGSVFAGINHIVRSPYLLGICAYLLLYTVGSTFLYFQQTDIIGRTIADRAGRTAFLARMDFTIQTLTIVTQVFLTGKILKRLGVAFTLGLVPALSVAGFFALGLAPTLSMFVVFNVLRKAGEYSLGKPAREVLFTVVRREDKYKAKSFIDTFVYRGGDQVAAWSNALMNALGMGAAAIAFTAIPIMALWLGVAGWLGKRQQALARGAQGEIPVAETAAATA